MGRESTALRTARPGVRTLVVVVCATASVTLFAAIGAISQGWSTWAPAVWCLLGALVMVSIAAVAWWMSLHPPAEH
jgi:hypothetical protein